MAIGKTIVTSSGVQDNNKDNLSKVPAAEEQINDLSITTPAITNRIETPSPTCLRPQYRIPDVTTITRKAKSGWL